MTQHTTGALPAPVVACLGEARELGFFGPGPLEGQLAHALAFAHAVDVLDGARCVDIGSGGGLPALVLAAVWPSTRWTLVDSMRKRTSFLERSVAALGWEDRVEVLLGRTEDVVCQPGRRHAASLVTARGFGRPSRTAEAAAAFLSLGGRLVVSEPPGWEDRWPRERLGLLGLVPERTWRGEVGLRVLRQSSACPPSFPRAAAAQAKAPLWD